MSRSIFSCFLLTSLGFVGGVDGVRAGEPAAQLQKIVLPGENKDSLAELLVADRLVDPKHSPQALGSIIGLGSAPGPLGPIPALALERINQQQWAEAMDRLLRALSVSERGLTQMKKSDKACCLMEWNDDPQSSFLEIREILLRADI